MHAPLPCHCNASCLGAFVLACPFGRLSADAHSCIVAHFPGCLACTSPTPAGSHPWAGLVSARACFATNRSQCSAFQSDVVTKTMSWTLQAARPSRPGLCSAAGSAGPPAQTSPAWALKCRTGPGRQCAAHARPHRRAYGIRDQEDDCQESWLASGGGAALCHPSVPSHRCRHGHSAPPSVHSEGPSCSPGSLSGRTALHLCAAWVPVTRWVQCCRLHVLAMVRPRLHLHTSSLPEHHGDVVASSIQAPDQPALCSKESHAPPTTLARQPRQH